MVRGFIRSYSHWIGLIDRNVWIALLSLLIVHFLMLTLAFHYESPATNHDERAECAFQRLVLTAAKELPSTTLEGLLEDIDHSTPQLKNSQIAITLDSRPKPEKISFSGFPPSHTGVELFPHRLGRNQWLNYTETSANSFYNYLVTLLLCEAFAIALFFFYVYTVYRFTKPLRKFKLSAEHLGISLNAMVLEEDGPSVVQETASAMNRMQQRIQDLINTRTQILAAISHDLRTPITRIRLRTEFMTDEKQAQKISNDLTEMETMVRDVLSFASNDITREEKVKLDLNTLLLSICDDFAAQGERIHYQPRRARSHFTGCAVALKRVFTNLINNALKYAGEAWVKLAYKDDKIIITIEDNGPGIPENELTQVFQPYYRTANTASSKPGTGLGMTIAYEIIHAHSGTIQLANRTEGGLQVTITLPQNVDR